MISALRSIAKEMANIKYAEFLQETVDKAKLFLADAIACSFGGRDLPWSEAAKRYAQANAKQGNASIWTGASKVTAVEAAYVNGVLAHSTLQEDMHITTYSHPGSIVVPAAVAVAEEVGATGKELLRAIVIGYEAMLRIGVALHTKRFEKTGIRPSGFFGPFGSAAAACALMGLDEDSTVNALGLSGNTGAGFRRFGVEGTWEVYFQNGAAARNGVVSALLARDGVTGAEYLLEGRGGIAPSVSGECDWSLLHRVSQHDWEINNVYFKPVAGCSAVQTVAQLALKLAIEHDLHADSIESIRILTHVHGKNNPGTDYAGPFEKMNQAQMSNQFAAAVAIVKRDISFLGYKDFRNESILLMAAKCTVEVSEEIEASYPTKKGAMLVVKLKDGRQFEGFQADTQAADAQQIYAKLERMAEDRGRALVTAIEAIDEAQNIWELSKLLS